MNREGTRRFNLIGMHDFHELEVVAVVDGHTDEYGTLHRERLLEGRGDLVRGFDRQAIRAKRLCQSHNVHGTKIDGGGAPVRQEPDTVEPLVRIRGGGCAQL
jgi:hypothetical protein